MKARLVKRFRGGSALAACAAGLFERALRLSRAPVFTVALPGGKTPLGLFKALAAAAAVPWDRVHFFMSDERLVPSASAGSNFGQARRRLFSKIKLPARNLHPVKTASPTAAAAYEKELKKTAGPAGVIDIVFLGLGADGHTASLFPGSPALKAGRELVAPSLAPAGTAPRRRVTLTPEAIGRAAAVVLMAAGPAKKAVFNAAVGGDRTIPAGALRPRGSYYLLFAEKENC